MPNSTPPLMAASTIRGPGTLTDFWKIRGWSR